MNAQIKLIDFHAHILPGADHGSDGRRTSAAQLEMIKQAGVSCVIATPHFYPNRHRVEVFLTKRNECMAALTEINKSGVTVINGAEVLVCEGLEEMQGLEHLCIEGTKTILLEMPVISWSTRLLDTVDEIFRNSGLTPVMAHIDRYPVRETEKLLEIGVKAQLNASSLCRMFGKKHLMQKVKDGTVVAIGSDLHGAEAGGYKPFIKACDALGDRLEAVMQATARLIEKNTL